MFYCHDYITVLFYNNNTFDYYWNSVTLVPFIPYCEGLSLINGRVS